MYKEKHKSVYLMDRYVDGNEFLTKEPEYGKLQSFEELRDRLPKPVWEGHEEAVEAYYKAWSLAFANIHNPTEENGFVSPYIDAAFNGDIFMWDSCFMLMFGIYANDIFCFQKTLDNFYANQLPDGFIPRQIHEDNGEGKFMRFDPISTGPNILGWCEWEFYLRTGDKERLRKVFYPLRAYHRWLRRNRTWQNMTYWNSGWGSGMDNQPRLPVDGDMDAMQAHRCYHGHMSWIDTNLQQILSCRVLLDIIRELNLEEDTTELTEEYEYLKHFVNEKMWSSEEAFYFDRYADGSLAKAKTVGAYWALLAGIVPKERLEGFLEHLRNEKEFKRLHMVPSLSADSEGYDRDGDYWCGSVWAPTNYMVIRGLRQYGEYELAAEIAKNHYQNVLEVYRETGTFWENYAPEYAARGSRSKGDFVGWTGLVPITELIEDILGIQLDVPNNTIHWYLSNLERHGMENMMFGARRISLCCAARQSESESPVITAEGCEGIRIIVHYDNRDMIWKKA